MVGTVIEFRIDSRSGVPPYRQIVQQVHQALRLGLLHEADQLPTVKEVVGQVAINPNTVLKAYRELERDGVATGRPGVGTFITRSLADQPLASHRALSASLVRWLTRARQAGFDDESIAALFDRALRGSGMEDVA